MKQWAGPPPVPPLLSPSPGDVRAQWLRPRGQGWGRTGPAGCMGPGSPALLPWAQPGPGAAPALSGHGVGGEPCPGRAVPQRQPMLRGRGWLRLTPGAPSQSSGGSNWWGGLSLPTAWASLGRRPLEPTPGLCVRFGSWPEGCSRWGLPSRVRATAMPAALPSGFPGNSRLLCSTHCPVNSLCASRLAAALP